MKFQKAVALKLIMGLIVSGVIAEVARADVSESPTALIYRGEGFLTDYVDGDELSMMDMAPSGPAFTKKDIPARIVVVVDAAKAALAIRVVADKAVFPNVNASDRQGKFDEQWECEGFSQTDEITKQYIPTRAKVMVAPVAPTVVYRAACFLMNSRAKSTERSVRLISNAGGFTLTVEELYIPQKPGESTYGDYRVMSGPALRREPR